MSDQHPNPSQPPRSPSRGDHGQTPLDQREPVPVLEHPPFRSIGVSLEEQQRPLLQTSSRDAARSKAPVLGSSSSTSRPPLFPQPAEIIDLNDYRPRPMEDLTDSIGAPGEDDSESGAMRRLSIDKWVPVDLPPVPAFYPLEKSSRLIDDTPQAIAFRIAECCRQLSVQASYDNVAATASLFTLDHVEMHLCLWRAPPIRDAQYQAHQQLEPHAPKVVIELQRRKGDSIAFHRYARSLLDAAVGLEGEYKSTDPGHFKHAQRLLQAELRNQNNLEHENAIIALEMAHGLLKKDRMDARQLGLESLCLLSDPRKTSMTTAVLTAHVVLLGTTQGVQLPGDADDEDSNDGIDLIAADETPFHEIREAVLSLVQFSKIGLDDEEDGEEVDDPDSEHMILLHNLALAVLANSLDVIENPGVYYDGEDRNNSSQSSSAEDSKPRGRLRTASSNDVTNEFLQQTEEMSNKEILSTLIAELGNAARKPHNATLSAKCLGSLCRASDDAKKRAKELGAKTVVSTALDVGVRTHLKLETECKKVVQALERPDDETDPRPPPPPPPQQPPESE